MKKGEIYFVELEKTTGSEQGGKRPVMVLHEGMDNTVLIAALTTKTKRKLPVHVELDPEETGLNHKSIVLLEQIRPISSLKLEARLGFLSCPRKMQKIERGLRISLGLGKTS